MKKLLSVLVMVSLLGGFGCDDDEPTIEEPIDQLPPLTTTGENTFGCLVNGEAWVPQSSFDNNARYQSNFLTIGANIEERESKI